MEPTSEVSPPVPNKPLPLTSTVTSVLINVPLKVTVPPDRVMLLKLAAEKVPFKFKEPVEWVNPPAMDTAAGERLTVPLLDQLRLAPNVPPDSVVVLPACVIKLTAVLASIVPAVMVKLALAATVKAPAPVKVPPLMVVAPRKMLALASDRLPLLPMVMLPSLVNLFAACPALDTVTKPAPDPM